MLRLHFRLIQIRVLGVLNASLLVVECRWSYVPTTALTFLVQRELLLCFLNLDKQNIASELALGGVKWKFNTPAAPHHGGVWEGLVQSFKQTLYAVLGNRRLTDEILLTAFYLVEQSLNNRPLTSVSSDANDLDALTPNHFLMGIAVLAFLHSPLSMTSITESDTPELKRTLMPFGKDG